MSEPFTNGKNGKPRPYTTAGMLSSLSERLVAALPPAFLLLVILNICFLAMATWVFSHNSDQRNAMLTRIVESCLTERK